MQEAEGRAARRAPERFPMLNSGVEQGIQALRLAVAPSGGFAVCPDSV
jgi:hypothetical protein